MSGIDELMRQGGAALVAIVALSVAAWTLIAWRFGELWTELRCGREVEARLGESGGVGLAELPGAAGRAARLGLERHTSLSFERGAAPVLEAEALELQRGLGVIAVIASILPLLGLLGTVLGMVATFGAITSRGSADAGQLADGVSQALVTTQAGLVAGLPVLLAHRWLSSRAERCSDMLERIARRAEEASACSHR